MPIAYTGGMGNTLGPNGLSKGSNLMFVHQISAAKEQWLLNWLQWLAKQKGYLCITKTF